MIPALRGIRVALVEARMQGELADLVRRHGGEPYSVPAMREGTQVCAEAVAACIDGLTRGAYQIVVFLTGVGAKALFQEAAHLGRLPELLTALRQVTTVCRGPKPVAVLRQHQVPVLLRAPEPHTTAELLAILAGLDIAGQGVVVVHYGERNTALATALQTRGAQLEELCLYEWLLPEDLRPLRTLVQDLVAGQVDAIAFTTQVQVRHLWQVAAELGLTAALTEALRQRCIVAAVGPVCAAALAALGVTPHVVPTHPKMGPMVMALVAYVEQHFQEREASEQA